MSSFVQRIDHHSLLEHLDGRRRRPRPRPDGRRARAAAPGAPRSPPPVGRPPTLRSDPQAEARRREARAPRDSPTPRHFRGRARPPPRTRRRRPPPSRPDTAPACRPAAGEQPKPRRPPPPAPAERHTTPDESYWPPPHAPAPATTTQSPAPDELDAQAPAQAASPGSWPYAGATRPRAQPLRPR